MLIIFKRMIHEQISPDIPQKVECEIMGMSGGKQYKIGHVEFPNKQDWTRFVGAFQRGVLGMKDMTASIENVPPPHAPTQGPSLQGATDVKP